MTRTLLVLPVLATLLVAGCSSSDDEPGAAPTSATPSPTATADEGSASSADPGGDPFTWYSTGAQCTELDGPLLTSELIRVKRPVTLTGLELDNRTGDVALGEATYVAKPKQEVPYTGGWRGTAPVAKDRDRVHWADRQPIAGADVEPGFYYVFLPLTVDNPSSYDGVELAWTDATEASGFSLWDVQDTFRRHCR